jgi:hypothetical protein
MGKIKNTQIQENLNSLYLHHFKVVSSYTLNKFINDYITEWDNHYKSIGIKNYKDDDEVKELLNFAKNKKINEEFINVKMINIDESKVVEDFKNQIIQSIKRYESDLTETKSGVTFQSLFIEDDYFPTGFISLYGKGNFKVTNLPEYIDFDYNNLLFNENCKVDYFPVMEKFVNFMKIVEEVGLDNYIFDSELYDSLSNMYRYKTYLLLHFAFKDIDLDVFKGIKIKKPFYVFANEHDCEVSNIFIFD